MAEYFIQGGKSLEGAFTVHGAKNAALLAAKILATNDPTLLDKLKAYKKEMKEQVEAKDARLQEVGYKNY